MPQPVPAPAGFRPLPLDFGFLRLNGPLHGKRGSDGSLVLGFRVDDRHVNPMNVCHGGMLMTFADMVLGFTASAAVGGRRFVPTINLTCDFLAPAPLGAWVEGRGRTLRSTRNLAFAECWAEVDGGPVLRANAIMRVPEAEDSPFDLTQMFT